MLVIILNWLILSLCDVFLLKPLTQSQKLYLFLRNKKTTVATPPVVESRNKTFPKGLLSSPSCLDNFYYTFESTSHI